MLRVISADVFEVVVVRSIWCIGVDARVAAPSPSAWEVWGAVCRPGTGKTVAGSDRSGGRHTLDRLLFRPSGSTGEPAAAQRGAVPSIVGARGWLLSLLSPLMSTSYHPGRIMVGRAASALSRLARIRAACR